MKKSISEAIRQKESTVAVVGLGYVGLPMALHFAKKIRVVGYDISKEKIISLKKKIDPNKEVLSEEFENKDITFCHEDHCLAEASFFIVAVPTPVDGTYQPNLKALKSATSSIGRVLKNGDYVVFESTVYPGATEEVCIPLLEKISGLKAGEDFFYGYSPERINPGDNEHTFNKTMKIVSGCTPKALEEIAQVYQLVIEAGVHQAPNIKVAEAAKIVENIQRDINIALMNELSMIFNLMSINTYDVLEAAKTKWNFLNFSPGLVGGHCISVDPYYMVHKVEKLKGQAPFIGMARFINESMSKFIVSQIVQRLAGRESSESPPRILVMGATFKENVTDIRNTKVVNIVNQLNAYNLEVDIVDPHASEKELKEHYNIDLKEAPSGKYDTLIMAVPHKEYTQLKEVDIKSMLSVNGLFVDVKGVFRNQLTNINYWSL